MTGRAGCRCPRPWCRWWAAWSVTFLVTGVAADVAAYVKYGWPATLSGHTRRWLGMEPVTRYGRLGQAAILGGLGWGALHLAFGILGPTRGRRP